MEGRLLNTKETIAATIENHDLVCPVEILKKSARLLSLCLLPKDSLMSLHEDRRKFTSAREKIRLNSDTKKAFLLPASD